MKKEKEVQRASKEGGSNTSPRMGGDNIENHKSIIFTNPDLYFKAALDFIQKGDFV
ncbi:hypothetical cytosolic protein [Syntrophus aciditrophicus SB]|uniref:Hypothetical cytosolic protein n=1 Tax=Syntrophus aciditrophicus (strain SB) TaxID=56780 RepID=Q2LQW1_SYNAS|nr:hypothetical cytosolic protein [Syntrophus aciditrophicus SB]